MKKWLLIFLFLPCALWADSTTVFSGTSGLEDSWMSSDNPTTNYGSSDTIMVCRNTLSSLYWAGLIRPLGINDTIPDTAHAVACTLTVKVVVKSPTAPTVYFQGLCRPWVESQATYNIWKTGYWWTIVNAGKGCTPCDNNEADSSGCDYNADFGSFTATIATHKIAIDTVIINDWIQGVRAVNGLKIYNYTNTNNYCKIMSSESANSPELMVVWAIDSTVWFDARHGCGQVGRRHGESKASVRHGRP
jgi:hypothetical protein